MKGRAKERDNELEQANKENKTRKQMEKEQEQAIAVGRSPREGLRFSIGATSEPPDMHSVDQDEDEVDSLILPDK